MLDSAKPDSAKSARRLPTSPVMGLAIVGFLATLLIVVRFYWPVGAGLDVTGHQIGRDFINNWVGPRLAFTGRLATLFDLDAYHAAIGTEFGAPLPFHNWGYPPFTLLLLWPLAQAPYFAALAIWTLASFGAFAAVTLSRIPAERRIVALLTLALAPACLINAVGGQNGFLTAALLLGGLLALDRRPILAGILFGLLTCKPHLGLVLPFVLLALGAWRAIGAAILTTLALVTASIAALGIEPWRQYLGATSAFQYSLLEQFQGFYPYMMTSVFAGARTAGLGMAWSWALQAGVSLPVLGLTIWAVQRTNDPCLRAGLVATAASLLTPYAFNYDLTAVAAVLIWRLFRAGAREATDRVTMFAWILPVLIMPLQMHGFGGGSFVLIALFAVLFRDVAKAAPWSMPTRPYALAPG